ncbi:hypothetical protein N7490_002557 [Penicillium lividum]|nr:hypothetical protein N7490_002557 [Penicillium lividum]
MTKKGEKRERKTNITRSRTGCHTCRRRRVKCDEDKPFCKTCVRLGLTCDGYGYIVRYRFTRPTVVESSSQGSFNNIEWAPVAISCINIDDMDISDGASVQEESVQEDSTFSRSPESIKETENDHVESSSQEVSPSALLNNDMKALAGEEDLNFDTSDARTLEEFYFTQWKTCVIPILPPVFAELTVTIPEFLPFRYAVLAVSACHLAHTGASYYGKGIRELAAYVNGIPDEALDHLVATSLLFYYIEIDVGSIAGAVGQMESINRLHCSAQLYVKQGSIKLNPKLLATWKSSRSLSVNKQHTIGSDRTRPLVGIQPPDPDSVEKGATSYDRIIELIVQSYSTIRTITVDFFVCRGTSLATEEQRHLAFGALVKHISSPDSQSDSPPQSNIEKYSRAVEQQRKSLDEWHTRLDLSELPLESFTSASTQPVREIDGQLEVQPLKFRTFEAAMNYAYYATAQACSSRQMFDRLTQSTEVNVDSFKRENFPWECLMLRIACGLDLEDCLYKHTYDIGILSLLICCASSCPYLAVATWIYNWMGNLGKYGMAVEDGMPLPMVMRVMRLIIAMKRDGHDGYRIAMMDSDIKEKVEFYQSNQEFLVAICAKDREKGIMYNNVVELPK